MPDFAMPNGVLTAQVGYKPGDLPPEGYLEWHEWADVQRRAGIKQVECGKCGKWKTPQELSAETFTLNARNKVGIEVVLKLPLCSKCSIAA